MESILNNPGNSDLSSQILSHYDDYYSEGIVVWRQLGAKYKAQNIMQMCSHIEHRAVLDIGAGEGSVSFELARSGFSDDITCLEVSPSALALLNAKKPPRGVREQRFDGSKIPFSDKLFDLAFASHVLEHVEHERLFLREAARVSKHLFIEVPLEDTLRSEAHYTPNQVGHINFYNRKTIRKLLESSGLHVLDLKLFQTPYEVYRFAGPVVGPTKFYLSRLASALGHNVASLLLTYHCGVLCTTRGLEATGPGS